MLFSEILVGCLLTKYLLRILSIATSVNIGGQKVFHQVLISHWYYYRKRDFFFVIITNLALPKLKHILVGGRHRRNQNTPSDCPRRSLSERCRIEPKFNFGYEYVLLALGNWKRAWTFLITYGLGRSHHLPHFTLRCPTTRTLSPSRKCNTHILLGYQFSLHYRGPGWPFYSLTPKLRTSFF